MKQESMPVGNFTPVCTNQMCFNSHQMSALVGGPETNKFEEIHRDGYHMVTGVPVQSRDELKGSLYSEVSCLVGPYSEVQCAMGNGHMGAPRKDRQTHTSDNIKL